MSELQRLLDTWGALEECPRICENCECEAYYCEINAVQSIIGRYIRDNHEIEPYTEDQSGPTEVGQRWGIQPYEDDNSDN